MRTTKIINKLEFKKEVFIRNWVFHIGSTNKVSFSRMVSSFDFIMYYCEFKHENN